MKKNKLILGLALFSLVLVIAVFSLSSTEQSRFWRSLSSWFAKPVDVKIDLQQKFKGNWDAQFAWNAAEAELERYSWHKALVACDQECLNTELDHRYLNEFELLSNGQERHILVASSNLVGRHCHACPAYLSLFEFEKIADEWQITKRHLNFSLWGSWGQADAEQIFLESLDKQGSQQDYLLAMFHDDVHHGYADTRLGLFYVSTQAVNQVVDLTDYHADNVGAVGEEDTARHIEWKGSHQFDYQSKAKLPDFVYTKVGVYETKAVNEQRRYRYDGKTYQLLQKTVAATPEIEEGASPADTKTEPATPDTTKAVTD